MTNLTNSLIVTQNQNNNNNNNPLNIPKKIKTINHHKKSKSQGAPKPNNVNNIANSMTINAFNKKTANALQNYKTSQEFFDSQQKRKK